MLQGWSTSCWRRTDQRERETTPGSQDRRSRVDLEAGDEGARHRRRQRRPRRR